MVDLQGGSAGEEVAKSSKGKSSAVVIAIGLGVALTVLGKSCNPAGPRCLYLRLLKPKKSEEVIIMCIIKHHPCCSVGRQMLIV